MGVAAVDAAIAVIRANQPVWHVVLFGWAERVDGFASAAAKSPTTPVTLLLLAAAAATVLSRRNIRIAVVITVGFVALVAPVSLHTGWWGPGIFSGLTATVTGLVAARTQGSRLQHGGRHGGDGAVRRHHRNQPRQRQQHRRRC